MSGSLRFQGDWFTQTAPTGILSGQTVCSLSFFARSNLLTQDTAGSGLLLGNPGGPLEITQFATSYNLNLDCFGTSNFDTTYTTIPGYVHHYALSWSASARVWYVDGVPVLTSATASQTTTANSPAWQIGCSATNFYLDFSMSDVAVWQGYALTSTDVANLATRTNTPQSLGTPATAWWTLAGTSGVAANPVSDAGFANAISGGGSFPFGTASSGTFAGNPSLSGSAVYSSEVLEVTTPVIGNAYVDRSGQVAYFLLASPYLSFTMSGSGVGQYERTILSTTMTAGGSGYTAPIASVSGGTPITAAVLGAPIVSGGVIRGIPVISPGLYSGTPTIAITDAHGTGAAASASLGGVLLPYASLTAAPTIKVNGAAVTLNSQEFYSTQASCPFVGFQMPCGGVASIAITAGGTGYSSSPTVTLSGGGTAVVGAVTVVAGVITAIAVSSAGSAYTFAPTVSITDGTGTGAHASALMTGVATTDAVTYGATAGWVSIASGSVGPVPSGTVMGNYAGINEPQFFTAPSTLSLGGNLGAVPAAPFSPMNLMADISKRVVWTGTSLSVAADGTLLTFGAATTCSGVLTNITGTNGVDSSGYPTSVGPTVVFSGGGGTGAAAYCTVTPGGGPITAITVTAVGSGYSSAPTVTIQWGSGWSATATATMAGSGGSQTVASVTVTAGGDGYNDGLWSVQYDDANPSAPTTVSIIAGASTIAAVQSVSTYANSGTLVGGVLKGITKAWYTFFKPTTTTWNPEIEVTLTQTAGVNGCNTSGGVNTLAIFGPNNPPSRTDPLAPDANIVNWLTTPSGQCAGALRLMDSELYFGGISQIVDATDIVSATGFTWNQPVAQRTVTVNAVRNYNTSTSPNVFTNQNYAGTVSTATGFTSPPAPFAWSPADPTFLNIYGSNSVNYVMELVCSAPHGFKTGQTVFTTGPLPPANIQITNGSAGTPYIGTSVRNLDEGFPAFVTGATTLCTMLSPKNSIGNMTVGSGASLPGGINNVAFTQQAGTILNVSFTAGGSGYVSPVAAFSDSTGSGATGACYQSKYVSALHLGAGGTGYTSAPTVTVTDSGHGYGATATANLTGTSVSSLTLTSIGINMTAATVSITGGGGSGATATATISSSNGVTAVLLTSGGSNYTAPTVSITDTGGGTGATGTVNLCSGYPFATQIQVPQQGDVPWEAATDLVNYLPGTATWVNIPHAATDACVTSIANAVLNNLDSGHLVYLEYMNEHWNGGIKEQWIMTLGLLQPTPLGRDPMYAQRAGQIYAIFATVFGAKASVLRNVYGTWTTYGSGTVALNMVDYLNTYNAAAAISHTPMFRMDSVCGDTYIDCPADPPFVMAAASVAFAHSLSVQYQTAWPWTLPMYHGLYKHFLLYNLQYLGTGTNGQPTGYIPANIGSIGAYNTVTGQTTFPTFTSYEGVIENMVPAGLGTGGDTSIQTSLEHDCFYHPYMYNTYGTYWQALQNAGVTLWAAYEVCATRAGSTKGTQLWNLLTWMCQQPGIGDGSDGKQVNKLWLTDGAAHDLDNVAPPLQAWRDWQDQIGAATSAFSLDAISGSFALTGGAAILTGSAAFVLAGASGTFALTGGNALLALNFIEAASGTFRLSGAAVSLFRGPGSGAKRWFPGLSRPRSFSPSRN